jgi:hypothetical protein
MTRILTSGNRAVVINGEEGRLWANVYTNARNGLASADITLLRWKGKSTLAAVKWATRQLSA